MIRWATEAVGDVDRLVDFVATYDPGRASEIEYQLSQAPKTLLSFPRRGSKLSEYYPREVREFRLGRYVLRYELIGDDISVLRVFHRREDR